jgi:hypothetical protein
MKVTNAQIQGLFGLEINLMVRMLDFSCRLSNFFFKKE